jgi:hypothetical protein
MRAFVDAMTSFATLSTAMTVMLVSLSVAVLACMTCLEQLGFVWPGSPFYFIFALVPSVALSVRYLTILHRTYPKAFVLLAVAVAAAMLLAIMDFYASRPRVPATYIVLAAILSTPLLSLATQRSAGVALIVYGVFLCIIVVLWKVPWNPRHQLLQDLDRIRIGMPLPEVDEIMEDHLKGVNPTMRPWGDNNLETLREIVDAEGQVGYEGTIVYRHSDDSADWGIVTFRNSQVVDVEFSRD